MAPLTFAYYCSGHGYGHATRVSAIAAHLRTLEGVDEAPNIHIVSSAPQMVFQEAIRVGALYRQADIDPVISQPHAYHVDRRKSVHILKNFILAHQRLMEREATWLMEMNVDCVLSDAAFLACKAAATANIPSVLITNFTFDSVFSYLSIIFPESSPFSRPRDSMTLLPLEDTPIPESELEPLVRVIHEGYRHASLLLRLPGNIPIPSFAVEPQLPSHHWTDPVSNRFHGTVLKSLANDTTSERLHPAISNTSIPRQIVKAPLIVRSPSEDIYTPSGRRRVLDLVGVPVDLQAGDTKILVVSFGGQVFRRPQSRVPSRGHSPALDTGVNSKTPSDPRSSSASPNSENDHIIRDEYVHVSSPVITSSHIWVPGAPPATRSPMISSQSGQTIESRPSDGTLPAVNIDSSPTLSYHSDSGSSAPLFLPDESWIAIICGALPSDSNDELPDNFFIAPKDIYMPDLTALSDVLLGKLGYGTTSECVDASTPFVFVPRPLFVEEHGLRRLLEEEGVGLELSQDAYENGDWASAIHTAYEMGKARKSEKRRRGDDGERNRQGKDMAGHLVQWVRHHKHG